MTPEHEYERTREDCEQGWKTAQEKHADMKREKLKYQIKKGEIAHSIQ